MALRETFNPLSGKIVKVAEFDARVEELGLSREERLAFHQKMAAMGEAGQLREINTLMNEAALSLYLPSSSVSEIEEDIVRNRGEELGLLGPWVVADAFDSHIHDTYCSVLPMLKISSFVAGNDQKLVDILTKAAELCADHRGQLAEMQQTTEAMTGVFERAKKKLGFQP